MGFPRPEYWSGLPFPPPGNLPDAGIEPASPALGGGSFTPESPGKPSVTWCYVTSDPSSVAPEGRGAHSLSQFLRVRNWGGAPDDWPWLGLCREVVPEVWLERPHLKT